MTSHPINADPTASEIEDWGSRDSAIKFPHFMSTLPYLNKRYGVPKFSWQSNRLRYHYTDAAGLIGILSTNRLWATDVKFLNDPSEGQFLSGRILSLMRAKEGGLSPIEASIVAGIALELAKPPRSALSTLTISFCSDGDLLSQWRGYGSFGRGYAVGLELSGGCPHPQIALSYDVIYGDGESLEVVALDILEIFAKAFEKWKDDTFEMGADLLRVLAHSFKDPSYREEAESRVIASYDGRQDYLFSREAPIAFRAQAGNVVPYIPLAFTLMREGDTAPALPIRRIIVGPGVDFERNKSSVLQMLAANGYHGVEVSKSEIPFRP